MKRGALWGIIGGATVVVLAGGIGVGWMLTRPEGPDAAAQRYLSALEEGEWEPIEAMLPDSVDAAERTTVREAFSGASARIQDASLGARTTTQDGVGFAATVTLDGAERTVDITMIEGDAGWTLGDGVLATLTTTTTLGTQVRVGGVEAPVGEIALLPAVYPVSAAPTGILAGETSVAVSNDEPATADVEASLAPDAAATVQAQLDPYLDACTEPAATIPDGCGIRVPWGADLAAVTGFAYRIEARPVVAIADDVRSFRATGGDLVITASGTTAGGDTASFTYRDPAWTLDGSIGFDATGVVLSVF